MTNIDKESTAAGQKSNKANTCDMYNKEGSAVG